METAPITDEKAQWKQRFRLHQYIGRFARCNHQRGLVISNKSGIYQLYLWTVPNGKLSQLTHQSHGKESGVISGDGHYVYYLNDTHGDETGHFVRVDVDTGEQIDLTPDAVSYSALGIQTDCTGKTIAYIIVDPEKGCQLFTQSVMTNTIGKPTLIYQSSSYTINPVLSYDGELVVIETMNIEKGTGSTLLVFDTVNGGQQISTLDDGTEINLVPKQFAPLFNDARLLATSSRIGVNRPLIWNVRTNERIDLVLDQLGIEGDVVPLDWSDGAKIILLLYIHNALFQLYTYCVADGTLNKLAEHPSGTIFYAQFGPNGTILVQWENANSPRQVVAINDKSGAVQRVMLGSLNSEILKSHPRRSITFPSSDGQLVQGWLTLPEITGGGPFPTIIQLHGGPADVTSERFSPYTQAWVDHGFAHFAINYRGSTTFGREFEHKIYSNIGHWEIEDIVAGRTWLIEQGIAQSNTILLTGWSYGGFLTLLALGKQPSLWAGGLAGIAIADWAMLYEDSAQSLKTYETTLFGCKPEEKPELYTTASPITYVEHVVAPVLVIQATNDTRCPARQMKQYEAKMNQFSKNFEIEWFDGGHSLNNTEQSILHLERMLCWTYHVLGRTVHQKN